MIPEENTSRSKRLRHALLLRCPNCGKAAVFYKGPNSRSQPQIHEKCENCGYHFNRGKDFFKGAMVFSYALLIVEALGAALIAKSMFLGLGRRDLILVGLAAMFFCSRWNYRFARILWLGMKGEIKN